MHAAWSAVVLASTALAIAAELGTPCPPGGPLSFGQCALRPVAPLVVGVLLTAALWRAGLTHLLPGNWLLLYGTGGLAYGRVDASANLLQHFDEGSPSQFPASISKTKVGWTAGAGAEWMFARNWSAKLEYLYIDLGDESAIGHVTLAPPEFNVGYTWRFREKSPASA